MAAPAQVSNFFASTGDGKVALTWDLVAGAVSYNVYRSIDGINFPLLASATTNSYLDTTAIINTQYWYTVASVGSTALVSGQTSAQTVIPTLPGKISLGELRLRSQQRADRENSMFVTTPEWNFFINKSYAELYDMLITSYEDYYVAPRLTIPATGASTYDLPNGQNYSGSPALYKLYGVDCGLDNSNNALVTIKKFDFISRNRYVYPQLGNSLLGVNNLQYRMVGGQIMFIPIPTSVILGLWYYPRLTTLLQDTDVMDGISGWEEYVIVRAAKYALDKEESPTDTLSQELVFLKDRIEAASQSRDAGQSDTVSDTRGNGYPGGGWGPNGDSGGAGW